MAAEGRAGTGEHPRLPDAELGKAAPYGIYEVTANTGWVNVGADREVFICTPCGTDEAVREANRQTPVPW